MRGSDSRCTTCAPGAGAGARAGAGVPILVGAAAPERRKLPQVASVVLFVLLGCDMTNTCCCTRTVAECIRVVVFFSLFRIAPGGEKAQEVFLENVPAT